MMVDGVDSSTQFLVMRQKRVEGVLPAERMAHQHHFLDLHRLPPSLNAVEEPRLRVLHQVPTPVQGTESM